MRRSYPTVKIFRSIHLIDYPVVENDRGFDSVTDIHLAVDRDYYGHIKRVKITPRLMKDAFP